MNLQQKYILLGLCKSIKDNSLSILKNYDKYNTALIEAIYDREKDPIQVFSSQTERQLYNHLDFMKHELNGILSTFDDVITRAKELGIKIEPPSNKLSVEGMCRKLIVHCDCIITTIEYSITPLSTKQKDNLDSFKKEVGQICRLLDYNFEVSINKSIQSLNEGDNLGSSLITAKILDYMLSQLASNNNIDGKNITDKIKTLVDEDIIDADKEIITKLIIKTDKKVRNALVHNISYHPDTAEALSLLGDCVSVMKIYAKVNSHFETQ